MGTVGETSQKQISGGHLKVRHFVGDLNGTYPRGHLKIRHNGENLTGTDHQGTLEDQAHWGRSDRNRDLGDKLRSDTLGQT